MVAGIGLAFAAAFCGLAQGMAVSKAVEGISRQPEATPQIQLAMMIGLAFIESLVLYTLFIGIILLFVNPFMKYFVQ
ncbi:MAG: ATP synthase F0 subunit C [Elusimicrobia bacterium RIFOXYB2_FULL_48_7]|nr:MAG: ATP synthase F0 subunit C [Elusimicrobia bacterium RIFOXYB2_FULL_48_7]